MNHKFRQAFFDTQQGSGINHCFEPDEPEGFAILTDPQG
jgi:hypothetical protein